MVERAAGIWFKGLFVGKATDNEHHWMVRVGTGMSCSRRRAKTLCRRCEVVAGFVPLH